MSHHKDYPIMECVKVVGPIVEHGGAAFYQKWTCAGCRRRQTMNQPNKFFELAICEECNHVTDVKLTGCNYLLIASSMQ